MKCPHCNKTITPAEIARHLGSIKTPKASAASRANGKLGGRPKGTKKKKKTKGKQR